MQCSSNRDLVAKGLKIEDLNSSSGIWFYYEEEHQNLRISHVNENSSHVGDFQKTPMTPEVIFVGRHYPILSFSMDFVPGSNTTVTSQRNGPLTKSVLENNISVSYTPIYPTDVFTFTLYSSDNSEKKIIFKDIVIDTIDVFPTNIEGNVNINTLNNTYLNVTMIFSENVDSGIVTTFSSQSYVDNVVFLNGKCTFNYFSPTTDTTDKFIFTNLRVTSIQVVNKAPQFFVISNLKEQPLFSNWLYTPASQNFSYTDNNSLVAVFNKNIQSCTSITSSSGIPNIITSLHITGNQISFEWSSRNTGNVSFTFNGLVGLDGSIDADLDGTTVVGPIILNTPPSIIGWNSIQPTEFNTLYNLSVIFNKQLSTSRMPTITASDGSIPIFTSISGTQVNFKVTTTYSDPTLTIYTFNNVGALDGSIKNGATISAGPKIVSVEVDTNLSGSYLTVNKLVKLRTQKVKINISKPIYGTLSILSNSKCAFGSINMINTTTAEFTITPNQVSDNSLTIQSDTILAEDGSISTVSYTFDLIDPQTIVNLFESTNKNSPKTFFDILTPVTLSLEVTKEISPDLTGTSITSSNGIVYNISTTSILGKYYYNFNFTPTESGTDQTIYINNSTDLHGFKYNLYQSGLTFVNIFPSAILNVGNLLSGVIVSSTSIRKDVDTMISISLSADETTVIPFAKIYYASTINSSTPTLLGTYSVSERIISFPFTPTELGQIYFYVKCLTTTGIVQPNFLISSLVNVVWFAPSSVSAIFSVSGATSGNDYNVLGLAAGKQYSNVLFSMNWDDNIQNPLTISNTGALKIYVGGIIDPDATVSYSYNSVTKQILISSLTLGTYIGSLEIGLTITNPNGIEVELKTTGHTVYAVPDTVTITSTIQDGYSLIAYKETEIYFNFSNTNSTINNSMSALNIGSTSNLVLSVLANNSIVLLESTFRSNNILSALITPNNNQEKTFTFTFSLTRTKVDVIVPATEIYTFPESSSCIVTSNGTNGGSIVTLNTSSTLIWSFSSSLPSTSTHSISESSFATVTSNTLSPLTSRILNLEYTVTPTSKQDIIYTVSISFGGVTVSYSKTVLLALNIYVMPSSLSAVVSFTGISVLSDDASITSLAVGTSYGLLASTQICGTGNKSSIVLTLNNIDTITLNTNEIISVNCVDSVSENAYGTIPSYTYTSSSHSAFIRTYTLDTIASPSGYVKFLVIVRAPDGNTTTILSTEQFETVFDATSASFGKIVDGITLISGSNVIVPVTFTNSSGTIFTPSATITTNGTFSSISTSITSGTFEATYNGIAVNTNVNFICSPTRRRITVTIPMSEIFVWPTIISTNPVNDAVTLGVESGMITTLSSPVQNVVQATINQLSALDNTSGSAISSIVLSGSILSYNIMTTSETTYTASITLSVGSYSNTYTQPIVTADQIYVWPQSVQAILLFNRVSSGPDYNVMGFAAGRTYTWPESSIIFTLQGVDPNTPNTSAFSANTIVNVYISGTLVTGVLNAYTYRPVTNDIVITSMTLGEQTGSLQFGVVVTAPSGATFELLSTGHTVYAVPNNVVISSIDNDYSLVSSTPTPVTFTFSNTNININDVISIFSTGANRSQNISLSSTAVVSLANIFSPNNVLGATVTSTTDQQTFTFTIQSTRTSISCTVLATQIYTFPTLVIYSQPILVPGAGTNITATTNTPILSNTVWSVSPSSGSVSSGDTTSSIGTTINFIYTPNSTELSSGILSLTWGTITKTLSATFPKPWSVIQSSINSAQLTFNTEIVSQTLVLNGSGTSSLLQSNISVYLNTSNTQVSNCIVTGYVSSTGTVTFKITPTVSGTNTLYVKIFENIISYSGSSGKGFFVDYSDIMSVTESIVLSTSGCTLWYDGSDPNGTGIEPANNTTINTWADKSGNAYNATSTTSNKSKFVSGVYQTKGSLLFNGTQSLPIQYAVSSPYALNTGEPLTIFLVMYSTSSSAYLISGPQDGILNIGTRGNVFINWFGNNYSWAGTGFPSTTFQTTNIWTIASVLGSNGSVSSHTNGIEQLPIQNLGSMVTTLRFGALSPDFQQDTIFSGYLAEIIIYNRQLTRIERRQIEKYLSNKWGISIASLSYTMPTTVNITLQTLSYTNNTANAIIAVNGSNSIFASFELYYGLSSGATSTVGLTHVKTYILNYSGDTIIEGTFPKETSLYLYIRITSPLGATGNLIENATPLVLLPIVMPTSFNYTSTPSFPLDSFLISTIVVSPLLGLPLKCYYASQPGLTQVSDLTLLLEGTLNPDGQANLYGGTLPVGINYLYIRITDPDGFISNVIGNSTPITINSYILPTSFTFNVIDTYLVSISRDTGSEIGMINEVYYGTTSTETTTTNLTFFGSGADDAYYGGYIFADSDFPTNTTLYLYVLFKTPDLSSSVLLKSTTSFSL